MKIYLGIYFECDKIYDFITINIYKCSNCKKSFSSWQRFCHCCAGIIKEYNEKNKIKKDFSDYLIDILDDQIIEIEFNHIKLIKDGYENTYYENGVIIYILNCSDNYLDDENIIDFKHINNPDKIIKEFKNGYPDIIKFFEDNYKNKYKIKYGFISYYD